MLKALAVKNPLLTQVQNASTRASLTDATDTARPRIGVCLSRLLARSAFVHAIETAKLWRFAGAETALDVNSGAGELALALAPRVARVVALDPLFAPRDALRMWQTGGRGNIVYRRAPFAGLSRDDCDPREREEFDLIASYLGLDYSDLAQLPRVLPNILRRGGRFFAACPRVWFETDAFDPTERKIQNAAAFQTLERNSFARELERVGLQLLDTPHVHLPRVPVARVLETSRFAETATPTGRVRLLETLELSESDTVAATLVAIENPLYQICV